MLPTIGTSTFTRLEIDDGSMSIWMILRGFCAKCAGLPMTRSSKRAPMASTQSPWWHVAVLHRQVGLVRTMHPEHAEELRVRRGIRAEAHQRVGAREAEQLHQ